MQWCCWQCHWHHMMLMAMPTVSHDLILIILTQERNGANDDSISFMWCQHESHDQKSHVIPCFSCLCLMNKMVPLMMQLASHDSSAGTSGITLLKKSCFTFFHMEASHSVCHIVNWIFLFNRINFDTWRQAFAWHQARLSQVWENVKIQTFIYPQKCIGKCLCQ